MPQRNSNQVAITGWTDDTHYQIRKFDKDKNPVILSVDIKTGKSIPLTLPESDRDILGKSLPAGTTLGMNDVLSPDKKSVALIRENDIFFFTCGRKRTAKINK